MVDRRTVGKVAAVAVVAAVAGNKQKQKVEKEAAKGKKK